MIKLWSLKQDKKSGSSNSDKKKSKINAAEIRMQKDISEISLPDTMKLNFPVTDDLMNFELLLSPDEGFYKGGVFKFTFKVNNNYPHEPPKVQCTQKIYHPNIDINGNVCLNILREDWKPVLNINSVLVGLQLLFLEPNAEDPLNSEAAGVLKVNKNLFQQNVERAMNGSLINGEKYDRVRK